MPCGRADFRGKIVGGDHRRGHIDIHPEWIARSRSNAEDGAAGIAQEPVSAKMPVDRRGDHLHRYVHRPTGRNIVRQVHHGRRAHHVAVRIDQRVGGRPGAGADILQAPGLRKGRVRREHRPIRHGDIHDELRPIAIRSRFNLGYNRGRNGGGLRKQGQHHNRSHQVTLCRH